MKIALIVPVFRQWEYVPRLIARIKEIGQLKEFEFALIDNEPQDDGRAYEGANVIDCNKPGSYAARNAGIRELDADIYLFTDADCLPDDNWIRAIKAAFDISSGKTLFAGNVVIQSDNDNPSTAELYDIAHGLPQERYVSQGYAVTANLAVPTAVFKTIGLFDEERFSGGDADFCQRAIKAGFDLKFIPQAIVYHPARKTWAEYATKVRRMKGGQVRAGKLPRRIKYVFITLTPPVWRLWRTLRSDKLKLSEKTRVIWFQFRLWCVELAEMFALICGKTPERR
jgi:GT2 family glycosyltransferase